MKRGWSLRGDGKRRVTLEAEMIVLTYGGWAHLFLLVSESQLHHI